jgi:hypothetical protein
MVAPSRQSASLNGMYPGDEVLKEVGRITIAGAQLDVWMGLLWHHLDMTTTEDACRGALGSQQRKAVRRLAGDRLVGCRSASGRHRRGDALRGRPEVCPLPEELTLHEADVDH